MTSGTDWTRGTKQVLKVLASLVLGLTLSVLSFWDLVTVADYPLLGSPTLVFGVLLLLWGVSRSQHVLTQDLCQIIAVALAASVWVLAVGVMMSFLPALIGEVCGISLSWRLLNEVKRRRNYMDV